MNNFKVGDRVYHDGFGFGTVKVINGTLIGVEFDRADVRFGKLLFKNHSGDFFIATGYTLDPLVKSFAIPAIFALPNINSEFIF